MKATIKNALFLQSIVADSFRSLRADNVRIVDTWDASYDEYENGIDQPPTGSFNGIGVQFRTGSPGNWSQVFECLIANSTLSKPLRATKGVELTTISEFTNADRPNKRRMLDGESNG